MKYWIFLLGFVVVLPIQAADLTIFAGQQINADFVVDDEVSIDPLSNTNLGDDIALYDGTSYGVAMDFVFRGNQNQRIGFMFTRQDTQFGSNSELANLDLAVSHLHFTATNYYPVGNWEPFVMAGVGVAQFAPEDTSLNDDTFLSAQLAGGTNLKLTENILLRMEARWLPTFFNTSGAFLCSGGCVIGVSSDIYDQFQFNLGLQVRF